MRVIIAGSRRIPSLLITHPDHWIKPSIQEVMLEVLDEAVLRSGFDISCVLSGTSWGVDLLGEKYAFNRNLPVERYPANWGLHGKKAGLLRNTEMGGKADALICVCTETSTGSLHMIATMKKLDKPFFAMILE